MSSFVWVKSRTKWFNCIQTSGNTIHCTKNYISHVLEYHEKFKNIKIISTFHQLFRFKKPYFLSLKSSKQELFRIHKTWYSMLKKISSYINFLNKKKTVFPISEKFKTRTFRFSEDVVFHAKENIILHQFFESKEDRISHLRKVQNKDFSIIWTFPFVENSCFSNNFFFFHINLWFFWPF